MANHAVALPMAVESGSRAWGFPSPDSDYDCRFVFVRPLEHYLSPWQARDVIESQPRGLLDVNGWDLKKAIQLLVKGNAVILALRWLREHRECVVPPMSLGDLVTQTELSADVTAAIHSRVSLKAVTREMGTSQVPDAVRTFILAEFANSEWVGPTRPAKATSAAKSDAAAFFREAVNTYGPKPAPDLA